MTASSSPLQITRSRQNPPVLTVTGELDMSNVDKPGRAVVELLHQTPAPKVIVLELTKVSFISAAGITMLLNAERHASARRISLRVVAGHNRLVERCLRLTATDRMLDLYPDLTAASRL